MKCEIIRNNERIAGPMVFDANTVRDLIARQGGDFRLVPNGLTSAVKIGNITIKPVREIIPAPGRMEQLGMAVRAESEYEVTYTYPVEPRDPELVRASLQSELSRIHDAREAGRITHEGVGIKIDLEARINARGVLDEFKAGTMTETLWRGQAVTEGGPSKIHVTSLAQMQGVYDAILTAVTKGFAAKEAAETLIGAATEAELATLDVQAEFDAIANA